MNTIIEFIKANSSWLFSGAGSFILGVFVSIVSNWLYDKISLKNKDKLKIVISREILDE